MKNPILLLLLIVTFIACNTDKTKDFIPGTYVNAASGEYSAANDTLIIEAAAGNNYLILRKTGFHRITGGKAGKREYESEQWNATYDSDSRSLTEIRKGKLITFYPESGKLMVGKREYQKVR